MIDGVEFQIPKINLSNVDRLTPLYLYDLIFGNPDNADLRVSRSQTSRLLSVTFGNHLARAKSINALGSNVDLDFLKHRVSNNVF